MNYTDLISELTSEKQSLQDRISKIDLVFSAIELLDDRVEPIPAKSVKVVSKPKVAERVIARRKNNSGVLVKCKLCGKPKKPSEMNAWILDGEKHYTNCKDCASAKKSGKTIRTKNVAVPKHTGGQDNWADVQTSTHEGKKELLPRIPNSDPSSMRPLSELMGDRVTCPKCGELARRGDCIEIEDSNGNMKIQHCGACEHRMKLNHKVIPPQAVEALQGRPGPEDGDDSETINFNGRD